MARKLSTLNKGRSVNRKPVKSKGSGSSEYDWDSFTGKMGTVKLGQSGGEDGKRLKLYRSTGRGGPWVHVYFNPLDNRISEVMAGIILEVTDENCRKLTTGNGKDQVVFDLEPSTDGEPVEPSVVGSPMRKPVIGSSRSL